jgi:hypothetical protein
MANSVSSIYIWSKNFTHSAYEKSGQGVHSCIHSILNVLFKYNIGHKNRVAEGLF